jgi:hypothetical protein
MALPSFVEGPLQEAGEKWQVHWGFLSVFSSLCGDGRDTERIALIDPGTISDPPVIAWLDDLDIPQGIDALIKADSPEPAPGDDSYLNLAVDLRYPISTLLPLIQKEISPYSRRYRQGKRRSAKVDFQLQVYDLVLTGDNFKTIASKVRRRPSAVQKAWVTGSRNIHGPATAVPSRKRAALENFNPEKHFLDCGICRRATTAEEMCQLAKLWANQDQVSRRRRDSWGLDTTRGALRSATMLSPMSHPPD